MILSRKDRTGMSAGWNVEHGLFYRSLAKCLVVSNYGRINKVFITPHLSDEDKGLAGYRIGKWNVKPKL